MIYGYFFFPSEKKTSRSSFFFSLGKVCVPQRIIINGLGDMCKVSMYNIKSKITSSSSPLSDFMGLFFSLQGWPESGGEERVFLSLSYKEL